MDTCSSRAIHSWYKYWYSGLFASTALQQLYCTVVQGAIREQSWKERIVIRHACKSGVSNVAGAPIPGTVLEYRVLHSCMYEYPYMDSWDCIPMIYNNDIPGTVQYRIQQPPTEN